MITRESRAPQGAPNGDIRCRQNLGPAERRRGYFPHEIRGIVGDRNEGSSCQSATDYRTVRVALVYFNALPTLRSPRRISPSDWSPLPGLRRLPVQDFHPGEPCPFRTHRGLSLYNQSFERANCQMLTDLTFHDFRAMKLRHEHRHRRTCGSADQRCSDAVVNSMAEREMPKRNPG